MNETTTTPSAPRMLTTEEIKTAVKARHAAAVSELAAARAERDQIQAQIKLLVAEVTESARILRSVEGRKAKK